MQAIIAPPRSAAEYARDKLLGSLVGLARATVNEPKTPDTDRVLRAGLRAAAGQSSAAGLERMNDIVQTEKRRVAPNCSTCTVRCGNTDDYDLERLWSADETTRALKLRIIAALFGLSELPVTAESVRAVDTGLFALAEDWDEELLGPIAQRAEALCREKKGE